MNDVYKHIYTYPYLCYIYIYVDIVSMYIYVHISTLSMPLGHTGMYTYLFFGICARLIGQAGQLFALSRVASQARGTPSGCCQRDVERWN